jgi:hypothetical protein
MKSPVSTKIESQTSNRDIKCFCCLGVGHITSQCPNKRTMIASVNGEVETESEGNDDQMPILEDVCDDDVEHSMEDELLVVWRALSAQVKRMTWKNKGRTFFILDATSTTRYVV